MTNQQTHSTKRKTFGKVVAALLAIFVIFWVATMLRPATYGIWQTEGYGYYINVSPLSIELYDATSVSCYRAMRLPSNNFVLARADGIQFSAENGKLRIDAALNPIYGTKIDKLPDNCTADVNNDPELNYEIFWHTFNEQYAFFDLHGVNWDERYAEFRPKVTQSTTNEELFEIMIATYDGLDDGHTYLTNNDTRGHSPSSDSVWDENSDEYGETFKTYLRDGFVDEADAEITYGWLTDDIGYLSIGRMESEKKFWQDRLAVIERILDDVSAEFSTASSIIVDVRSNPGGFDQYALAIAESFTSDRSLAFSKTTRTASGYTDPFEVYLEPTQAPRFTQDVYLLTSDYTGSGAEIFTMAMRTMPQVTVVGQPTGGGLSDILARELPNGWSFGLSNQIYYAADGNVYEGTGVPADIDYQYDRDGFAAGRDSLLEEVIALAASQ